MKEKLEQFGQLQENVELQKYNTYKIGGTCKYLLSPNSVNDLINAIKYLKENNKNYIILGAGSNIILNNKYDGVVITFNKMSAHVIDENTRTLYAEAGAKLPVVAMDSINKSLTGLEFAVGIPGTIGGSVYGNAGAYNACIMDYIKEVTVLDEELNIKRLKKKDINYSYRSTDFKTNKKYIILAVKIKLDSGDKEKSLFLVKDRQKRRLESQPLEFPSAGSVFRNPEGDFAGRLIEECGLKGKTIGGAQVSEKHANFIINIGDATSKDIYNLVNEVHDTVLKNTGVDLIIEQEFIGWK